MTDREQQPLDPRWGETSLMHDPYILAHFEARPTDILITTAPKAGTTWMQQILHQLRTGGDDSFHTIDDVVPWLERQRLDKTWREMLDHFDSFPNPRIFKTHCTYFQTPGVEVSRIILSSRDPRDSCVSFYHHIMDMTDEARKRAGVNAPSSFDDFFERWLNFASWYRNVQSWWPHINDENVLWLRYEDMKLDLSARFDDILMFLGWTLSPEQRKRALNYCSFQWMKSNSEKFSRFSDWKEPAFKPDGFIRKGEVGDHNTLLSMKQKQRILDKANEMLDVECLNFLGLNVSR